MDTVATYVTLDEAAIEHMGCERRPSVGRRPSRGTGTQAVTGNDRSIEDDIVKAQARDIRDRRMAEVVLRFTIVYMSR